MSENLNALEKAQVLIEALPYIQRFNRKIIVVKYGGSAMVDEKLKKHSAGVSATKTNPLSCTFTIAPN